MSIFREDAVYASTNSVYRFPPAPDLCFEVTHLMVVYDRQRVCRLTIVCNVVTTC